MAGGPGQQDQRGDGVQRVHAGGIHERPVLVLEEVPDGAPVRRAGLAELVEPGPAGRCGDHHRHIHDQPGGRGRAERDPELAQPAGPHAEQQQRAEEQQRVELGRHRQPDEHAGQHAAPCGPGGHAQHDQAHGDEVPVDERAQDQGGGERHAERRPPAGPARQVGGGQHPGDGEEGEQQDRDVEELPAPGERVTDRADHPGGQLHRAADEHRVLDGMPEVGHLPGGQLLAVVQRVDVGVAVRLELGQVPVPGAGPAGPLVGQRERAAQQGRQDQGGTGSGQYRQPRRPGMCRVPRAVAGRPGCCVAHPRSVIGSPFRSR